MRAVWMAVAAAVVVSVPARAQMQVPPGLAVEVRGGASAGNYAAAATDFELIPQPSFGATVSYGVREMIELYAGYSRSSFGCDGGFCATRGMTFTSQGVDAGVRVRLPVLAVAGPWVRAGLVSHSLDYDSDPDSGPSLDGEADGGFGFEVGGGAELGLGRRLSVTPGIRYVRYGAAGDDGVAMLVGDVGLRIRM